MQPYELIMSPGELYIAHEGTDFPAVDATPDGNWTKLGANGMRNQSTAGVKVKHNQTIKKHSTAGSTGAVKAGRTGEELMITVIIEDLTLEMYARKMNLAGVTEVAAAAGVAGYRAMGLSQGFTVQTWALLFRVAASPYGDGMNMQWQVPKVIDTGNSELTFDAEGSVAGLALQYDALEDPNASSEKERYGKIVVQTAPATA